MGDQIRLRVAEAPVGGPRIAWSYLGVLLGLVAGGLFWAAWTPFAGTVCGGDVDSACRLGWVVSGGLVGVACGLVLPAIVLRLGWEWWCVLAALLLGSPLWADRVDGAVPVVVGVLAPALAAVATWGGPRRPRWRPWLVGGLALALVAGGVASVLL